MKTGDKHPDGGRAVHPSVRLLEALHRELRVCFPINSVYVSSFYSPTESNSPALQQQRNVHRKGELNGAKGLPEGREEADLPTPGRAVEMRGETRGPIKRGLIGGRAGMCTAWQGAESGYRADQQHARLLLGLTYSGSDPPETC